MGYKIEYHKLGEIIQLKSDEEEKMSKEELLEELDYTWINPYVKNSKGWKKMEQARQQIEALIEKSG